MVHIFTVAELSAKLQNFAPRENFTLYSIKQRIYAMLSMLYVYRIQSTGGAFDPPTQVTTNLSIDPWPTKVFVTVLKMLEKKSYQCLLELTHTSQILNIVYEGEYRISDQSPNISFNMTSQYQAHYVHKLNPSLIMNVSV